MEIAALDSLEINNDAGFYFGCVCWGAGSILNYLMDLIRIRKLVLS